MIQKIIVKDGVTFKELTVPVLKMINIAISVWAYHTKVIPTITSANDSKHSKNSLHYKDMAIDLRTKDLTSDELKRIFKTYQDSLGEGYDVVLESDHLHSEYDIK